MGQLALCIFVYRVARIPRQFQDGSVFIMVMMDFYINIKLYLSHRSDVVIDNNLELYV